MRQAVLAASVEQAARWWRGAPCQATGRGALAALVLLALAASPPVRGQPVPTAEQMIEQLKPAPRTRGLSRNLVIERAPAGAVPVAAPDQPPPPAAPTPPAPQAAASPVTPAPLAAAEAPAVAAPPPRPSLSLLIQFGFDSVEVQPESQQALANLAQALQSPQLAASRFVIEGHTDAKGRRDYNVRLSQRRADAVRDLLARQGVDAARLQTAGRGPDEPADPADPFAAANRRVRVVNID